MVNTKRPCFINYLTAWIFRFMTLQTKPSTSIANLLTPALTTRASLEMADDGAPEFDEAGRELHEDSGILLCPMNAGCSGLPKIFAPRVREDIALPPSASPNYYPSLYHHVLQDYREMCSTHDDADVVDALKGDFIVQLQLFSERRGRPNEVTSLFIGLSLVTEIEGYKIDITKTSLSFDEEDDVLRGLDRVAMQDVAPCPSCEDHMTITVWAEAQGFTAWAAAQGPTGNVDWEKLREDAEYMEEIMEEIREENDDPFASSEDSESG